MSTMEGFIAFTQQEAQNVEGQGRLVPETFGTPFMWVPFADTIDGAIEKAMMSSKGNPEAATRQTEWRVLHVWITADQFLEVFQDKRIGSTSVSSGFPIPGWRYYGDVELGNGNAFEWLGIIVGPIGIATWAEKALTKYKFRKDGRCCDCGAISVPTWTACNEAFCAGCWNRSFLSRYMKGDADEEPEEGSRQ